MLSPKKVKWRKQHVGRNKGVATAGNSLAFGDFGLQATSSGLITARQLEAARVAISRSIRRGGKIWLRVFPDKPMTKKPLETRMGAGKGNPEFWVARVLPGRVLFEINGVSRQQAEEAFRLAAHKLPVKTRFLSRDE